MPTRATDHGTDVTAAFRLAVMPGRSDDMRAEITVRVVGTAVPSAGRRLSLAGTLVGPRRGRDMTLPTTVPLVEVASPPSGTVLPGMAAARAVFTEPSYWTPELPNLYRLEARLLDGGTEVATFDRMVGLRRLGVRGRSLWLEGRRWVPRGMACAAEGFDPQVVRALHAAAVLADPHADLCAAADRVGVAIVARLQDGRGACPGVAPATQRIASWSLHPAVVLVVVPRTVAPDQAAAIAVAAKSLKGTMLVGLEVDGTQPPPDMPQEFAAVVDCMVVDLPRDGLPHEGWRSWQVEKPLVAQRASPGSSPAEHRHECDRLQAALAAWGLARGATQLPWDWAGYLV
jgi:hypothetical protein